MTGTESPCTTKGWVNQERDWDPSACPEKITVQILGTGTCICKQCYGLRHSSKKERPLGCKHFGWSGEAAQ
jgi:hypothetical protein